jgi:4-hydroxybenzoate polyprenyltransferase
MVYEQLASIIQTMRPKQWIKNGVIFAALVFDRQLGFNNLGALLRTFAGFIIFCLLSGVVYIINDIADVEADRNHPDKKDRPIASGTISISTARIAAVAILIIIFPLAYLLSPAFALVALAYFVLNLVYSKWLKHVPIIDVFSIALGFVLRVLAGAALITVARFSPWLYVVTSLGALLLGFGKRYSEISLLAGDAQAHRKVLDGYSLHVLDQFITIVSAMTIIAYGLYTFSAPNLPDNDVMMLTIPFVVYGILRYIYLLKVDKVGGAPEDLFLKDRPIQAAVILWGISILMIFYIF